MAAAETDVGVICRTLDLTTEFECYNASQEEHLRSPACPDRNPDLSLSVYAFWGCHFSRRIVTLPLDQVSGDRKQASTLDLVLPKQPGVITAVTCVGHSAAKGDISHVGSS